MSVKVTKFEVVYWSPLLINIDPVGGVSSFGSEDSAKLVTKNTAKEDSKRIRTTTETALFFILQSLLYTMFRATNMNFAIVVYFG